MRRKAKPACDPDVGEAAEARPRLGPDPRPGALRRFHACAQVEAGSQRDGRDGERNSPESVEDRPSIQQGRSAIVT